jgi:tetratricopeptide (TPR) repeat protein
VVHRDLKPGNILVTADGSPKLLDFGVAKLLDPETDRGTAPTLVSGRLLTPEYASPEQVRGEFVGTASDVYALGTLLYELLAGVQAQRVDSHTPAELERVICRNEIQAPSLRLKATNPRLSKRVSGDLDNIVLMAMRKEPVRRYSSVDSLAEDVRRHLDGRTVVARAPSLGYRLGKFAGRNRFWLSAAALVLISLAGGTWAALLEAHRARVEKQRAEARLSQMVELANRALFDVHGSIERLPGAIEARKQLVKTTLDFLEKLSRDAGSDERLRRALGAAYFRLGDVQGYPFTPNLGDGAGAMQSYRKSSTLLDPLRRAHPDDAEAQRLWLEVQERLAAMLIQTGDAEAAYKLLSDALPSALALAQLPHTGTDAEQVQGEFYSLLADAAAAHDSPLALPYARRYQEIFSTLAARFPDRGDFVLEQSNAYSLVGRILHRQGDAHGALDNFLRCVVLRETLVSSHPNDVVYKRNLMIGYGHVGDMLGSPIADNLGDSPGARLYYRKAFVIAQQISDADPLDTTAKFDVAASLERLGMVDVPASGVAESLAALRQSAGILESMAVNEPSSLRVKQMLALVLEYTGRRLQTAGRYAEATASFRRSLTIGDGMLAADPSNRSALSQFVASGRGLATALAMSGDRTGAIRQARETIARAEAGVNAGPGKRIRELYLAESTIELGSVYEILARQSRSQQNHDWESARSALRQAVALLDKLDPGNKLSSLEARDRQKAQNLLEQADAHLLPRSAAPDRAVSSVPHASH